MSSTVRAAAHKREIFLGIVFSLLAAIGFSIAGIRRIGLGDASLIGSIGPLFTIYLALVFLKEKGFAPAVRWVAAGLGWRSNGQSQQTQRN